MDKSYFIQYFTGANAVNEANSVLALVDPDDISSVDVIHSSNPRDRHTISVAVVRKRDEKAEEKNRVDLKESRRIIAQGEEILRDAEEAARKKLEAAQNKADSMVQEAVSKSKSIVDDAARAAGQNSNG